MKIIKNIVIVFILINIVFILCSNYTVKASTDVVLNPTYPNDTGLKNFGETIFGIIRNVAVISSVVVLAYCGMRIVFGSVEQKAEYKKTMMPYVIGAALVFGVALVFTFVQGIAGTLV